MNENVEPPCLDKDTQRGERKQEWLNVNHMTEPNPVKGGSF